MVVPLIHLYTQQPYITCLHTTEPGPVLINFYLLLFFFMSNTVLGACSFMHMETKT